MKRRLPRWYWWIGPLLTAGGPIGGLFGLWLILQPSLIRYSQPLVNRIEIASHIFYLLIVAAGIWGLWVCPLLASGDERAKQRQVPRKTLKTLVLVVWGLPAYCGIFAFVDLLLLPLYDWWKEAQWHWADDWRLGVSLAVAFIIESAVAWALSRLIRRRFIVMMARKQMCLQCGYDLRGSTNRTCPECGSSIDNAPPTEWDVETP